MNDGEMKIGSFADSFLVWERRDRDLYRFERTHMYINLNSIVCVNILSTSWRSFIFIFYVLPDSNLTCWVAVSKINFSKHVLEIIFKDEHSWTSSF